jgi:phosphomannomutase
MMNSYYLVFSFDAEGCVRKGTLQIGQSREVNPDVYADIVRHLSTFGFRFTERFDRVCLTGGLPEILRFHQVTQPAATRKFYNALLDTRMRGQTDRVLKIELCGEEEVVSLQTTTNTYFGQGYASRNCYLVGAVPYFRGKDLMIRPAKKIYSLRDKADVDPNIKGPFNKRVRNINGHNYATFNGFKIKSPHGGSADESVTFSIEDRMDVSEIQTDDKAEKRVDFSTPYLAFVKKFFKNLSLRNLPGPVVFDSMHGPGGRLFEKLLNGHDKIVIIRKEADPLFGGVNPEPIEVNLDALKEAVQKNKAVAGIAVDGDADRIGLIDEKGRYLPPHTVMPLLLLHLIENKKLKGRVMQTVSMGFLNGRIATKFNLPFEEVPVGFKHIAKKMREEKVLFGGEESGGYGVGLWFAERDALINALLVIELLTHTKKKLSELVDDLYKRFGVSHFKRTDYVVPFTMEKAAWTTHVVSNVGQMFAGLPVKSVSSVDGVKIILSDDSWVLMRPSGTEPLIRTYAESVSGVTVDKLLQEADRLVHIPPPNAQKDAAAKKAAKARAAKKKQAK